MIDQYHDLFWPHVLRAYVAGFFAARHPNVAVAVTFDAERELWIVSAGDVRWTMQVTSDDHEFRFVADGQSPVTFSIPEHL